MYRILWSRKAKDMPKRVEKGAIEDVKIVDVMKSIGATTSLVKMIDGKVEYAVQY